MNKATSVWCQNYNFVALGLPVPEDFEEFFKQDVFFKQYSSPMFMLCSGLKYEDFKFDVADKGDFEAQSYLANQVPKLIEPNRLIQLFNNLNVGFVWMYVLRDICRYVQPTTDPNKVVSNVRAAYNKYMVSHVIKYAVFDCDGTDVPVVVDLDTGKIVDSYPNECVIYPDNLRVTNGSRIFATAVNKPYYQLSEAEIALLDQGYDKGIVSETSAKKVSLPYVTVDGAVAYRDVCWRDTNKPPKDVVALYGAMSKSLIDSCGDELHALIAMVEDGATVSKEVSDYVAMIKSRLVDDFDKHDPASMCYGMYSNADEARALEEQGYVVTELRTLLEDYCQEYNISKSCSIQQFLDFYSSGEDELTPPVAESATLQETLNSVESKMFNVAKELEELKAKNAKRNVATELEALRAENAKLKEELANSAKDLELEDLKAENAKLTEELHGVGFNLESSVKRATELGIDSDVVDGIARNHDDVETFWEELLETVIHTAERPNEPSILSSKVSNYAEMSVLQLGVNPLFIEDAIKSSGNNDTTFLLEVLRKVTEGVKKDEVHLDMGVVVKDLTELGMSDDDINRAFSTSPEDTADNDSDLYRIAVSYLLSKKAATEEVKIVPKEYLDEFEGAGALMLNRVRKSIDADSSFENRGTLTDVMYTYFRLLMGDVNSERDEVIEALKTGAEKAQPQSKGIIEEAIRYLEQ